MADDGKVCVCWLQLWPEVLGPCACSFWLPTLMARSQSTLLALLVSPAHRTSWVSHIPFWTADQVSVEPSWLDAQNCQQCHIKFGLATRKHHW